MRDHTLVFFLGESTESAVGLRDTRAGAIRRCHHRYCRSTASKPVLVPSKRAPRGTCAPWRVFAIPTQHDRTRSEAAPFGLAPISRVRCGIVGLQGVALRSQNVAACEALWTTLFTVASAIGLAKGRSSGSTRHTIGWLLSLGRQRILSIDFGVDERRSADAQQLLSAIAQVKIVHARAASDIDQIFLTFAAP